ncbi:pectate lyase-like adhesive domain-containing protein [Lacticaseibacillus brantae]|uniref:WxL domain-containing protein n=1 Tax=Lacticaseibacillus brantae DSM 23927 TaxID=1423727 RepID=A0A0R2B707_9LACO|nr:pectate lyase-like adhesive domain-containing protein [Lacticaseibacillus brantae]KRM71148.1 hypothetical protein FC34_GL001899 [Lacticaseibacillus brantae DSM 23927]
MMNYVTKILISISLSMVAVGPFASQSQPQPAGSEPTLPTSVSQLLPEADDSQEPIETASDTNLENSESASKESSADESIAKTESVAPKLETEFVLVSTPEEFKAAYEAGKDVKLANDIVLTRPRNNMMLKVIPDDGSLIIDGDQHELTLAGNDNITSILSVPAGMNDKEIVFQNMRIKNTNFYGVLKSSDSPTLVFNNVNYTGPQLLWVEAGKAIFRGTNNLAIDRHEFGEISLLIFDGGQTTITHTNIVKFLSPLKQGSDAVSGIQVINGAKVTAVSDTTADFMSTSLTNTVFQVDGNGSEFNIKFTSSIADLFSSSAGACEVAATNGGKISVQNARYFFSTGTENTGFRATNGGQIDINVTNTVFYGTTKKSPIVASGDSQIKIRTNRVGLSYADSQIAATDDSEISISATGNAFTNVSAVPITAEANSSVSISSQKNLFADYSSTGITAGKAGEADLSRVELSASATMFSGTFTSAFKTNGQASMILKASAMISTLASRDAENPLFDVASNSTMKVTNTNSLFGTVGLGVVRYKIAGSFSLQSGRIYDETLSRTFTYDFTDNSHVDISVTGQPTKTVLPFLGSSSMTIGNGAQVVLRSSSSKKSLIQGSDTNLIAVKRGKLEMEQSSQNPSVMMAAVNLETSNYEPDALTFRRVQFRPADGRVRDYPYINFKASFGKVVTITSNNNRFAGLSGDGSDKFTNSINYLLIDKVKRPDVVPDDLEVHTGQKEFEISGRATPGAILEVKFLDARGEQIDVELTGNSAPLVATVGSDGDFSIPLALVNAVDSGVISNFTIVIDANYPSPDQLETPVRVTVKQYDPPIIGFAEVIEHFDFGTVGINQVGEDIKPETYSNRFTILDTRKGDDRTGLKLFVRQVQGFTAVKNGQTHTLKDSLYKRAFKGEGAEELQMDASFKISEDDGLVLAVPDTYSDPSPDITDYLVNSDPDAPGMIQANFADEGKWVDETYTADLQWTLVVAPK